MPSITPTITPSTHKPMFSFSLVTALNHLRPIHAFQSPGAAPPLPCGHLRRLRSAARMTIPGSSVPEPLQPRVPGPSRKHTLSEPAVGDLLLLSQLRPSPSPSLRPRVENAVILLLSSDLPRLLLLTPSTPHPPTTLHQLSTSPLVRRA